MVIRMDRAKFDSLAVKEIGHACFEPIVPVYQAAMRGQAGQTPQDARTDFYQSLTPGQRALLFYTYYDHAIRSIDEFQRISAHFLSAHIFGIVKRGMEYFHDDDMLHLLSAIEQAVSAKEQSDVSELYHQLHKISPHTLTIIGTYIKENPAEFVCIE